MAGKAKSKTQNKFEKNFHRLGLLIICFILTIVITIFSIWYNLRRYDKAESDEGLFSNIEQRFREAFESEELISNL